METKQASENHNMLILFGNLQQQLSALHTTVSTSFQMHLGNKTVSTSSSVKTFLSCKLSNLLKRPLTTRTGLYETPFSSVLRRYRLETSMSCVFKSFTYIALNATRIVENNYTLFLPILAAACGSLDSKKEVQVAFDSIHSSYCC